MISTDVPIRDACHEAAKQNELRQAIEQLDRKLARKLIIEENVQLVDIESNEFLSFLFVAVQSRDPQLVRELLKYNPELNNEEGGRMLWLVAQDGNTEIASMLVRSGADVNWGNPTDLLQRGLLHFWIASDNPKKHQLALLAMEHGADIWAENLGGDTPLHYAVRKESFELALELIDRGAIIDEFVINEAARHPRAVELLPILIEGDFECATTVVEKISLVITYLCCNELEEEHILPVIEVLMDIEVPIDNNGFLISAVACGRIQLVELLLNKGFGEKILSILLHLATMQRHAAVAESLIKRGADIHANIKAFGFTYQYPIHTACESESLSNVKLLLRLGVDINVTDSLGNTPFSLIDEVNLNDVHREIIKHFAVLISKGMKVNDSDMTLIRSRPNFSMFYKKCASELQDMKQFKIFNHISFYTMFIEDVKRLSWLTRNCHLVENYNKARLQTLFPLYHAEIEWKFRNSERRKVLLLSQETATCEVLNDVLPNLVIAQIIYYLYMNNVKDFHYSMYT